MALFDFLFRRQRHIEAMIVRYLGVWEECLERFKHAMEVYLAHGLGDEFAFLLQQTHRLESRADDLRREIEDEMYAKQLLPESRGDILQFLENIDRVPNRAETILFVLSSELIELPEKLTDELRALLAATYSATDTLLHVARRVLSRDPELREMLRHIDERESECDFITRRLLRRIFAEKEIDGFDKLRLRDLVLKITGLSDLTMDVADRMRIMSLKRLV